jgi:beta-N-acetylhexosaminidase
MESGGVFPCFKHFPGHGATAHDSHSGAAVVRASARTLRARDLVPFAAAAKTARAVMGGHLLVEAFDDAAPATQSKVLIELLRGELGFDGAYVTDCLHMAAAGGDPVDAAVAAFRAGADLLLVSHSIDLANEAVRRISLAAQSGDLPAGRLREAHDRVTRLRAGARPPLALSAPPLHRGVGREAARRGVTLVRGIPHADPTSAIAISFEGTTVEGAAGEHTVHPSLRHESAALEHLELPLEPAENDVAAALAALARTTRRAIVLTRRANVHVAQASAVARIVAQDPDAVVVSMREPFDVPLFGAARHVLAAYGDDAASVGGLADVLFGGSAPEGTLPVEIPGA